ncbi:Ribonuclease Z [Candidatus Lokiarchaeum ossiferum]|uniref:Ribonuclease Z n=1 Tax=Candidatus Lokiarchaeum ossiferum TaxID=2951803 RepID=A0ABY6HP19_9ARCH|nr:Ribonuclease Z [Candidatus Lokiarchaeum sp. B-35]
MKLRFLGTSGYGITLTRNLPSIIIDGKILIDCGEGCLKSLFKFDYPLDQIQAIFVSHVHPDHILGLISLLFKWAFYTKNKNFKEIRMSPKIYVPEGYKSAIEQIIQVTFCPFENVNYQIRLIELPYIHENPLSLNFNTDKYSIDWIESIHHPKCYSFLFNGRLFYSGDSAPNKEFHNFIPAGTVIIHEASFDDSQKSLAHKLMHSTPQDAAMLASISKASQLILTHLPDLTEIEEEGFLKEAKKKFSNISVAHDGDLLSID